MMAIVNVGQELLLTIKRIGINGEGIGYYKRLAIFVDNALPGEECVVKIKNVYEKYAIAEMVRIKNKQNSNRVKPKCPYFGKCGGCHLQHASYEAQLDYKKAIVEEAFNKYYNKELNPKLIKNTIGMDNPYRYRNKAKLPVRYDGNNLVTGLYQKDENRLVYIDDCIVEKEDIRKCNSEILKYLTKYQVIAYNPKIKDGVLRHIVLRSSKKTKEIQVTLILYKEDERTKKIAEGLINIENVVSVYLSINSDKDALENFGEKTYLIAGKETITEELGGFSFELLPTAFFQLNLEQTEKLYQAALFAANLKGNEKVIDGFCGVGTIGIYLSKASQEVRGIDLNNESIINANDNVKNNKITNASFYCGDMGNLIAKWNKEGWNADVLVIDPPRTGLDHKMITYLQEHPIKRIVYVSCNPATLAKNCSHLERKYVIKSIQPLDMFPQTCNVECIVCLEKR